MIGKIAKILFKFIEKNSKKMFFIFMALLLLSATIAGSALANPFDDSKMSAKEIETKNNNYNINKLSNSDLFQMNSFNFNPNEQVEKSYNKEIPPNAFKIKDKQDKRDFIIPEIQNNQDIRNSNEDNTDNNQDKTDDDEQNNDYVNIHTIIFDIPKEEQTESETQIKPNEPAEKPKRIQDSLNKYVGLYKELYSIYYNVDKILKDGEAQIKEAYCNKDYNKVKDIKADLGSSGVILVTAFNKGVSSEASQETYKLGDKTLSDRFKKLAEKYDKLLQKLVDILKTELEPSVCPNYVAPADGNDDSGNNSNPDDNGADDNSNNPDNSNNGTDNTNQNTEKTNQEKYDEYKDQYIDYKEQYNNLVDDLEQAKDDDDEAENIIDDLKELYNDVDDLYDKVADLKGEVKNDDYLHDNVSELKDDIKKLKDKINCKTGKTSSCTTGSTESTSNNDVTYIPSIYNDQNTNNAVNKANDKAKEKVQVITMPVQATQQSTQTKEMPQNSKIVPFTETSTYLALLISGLVLLIGLAAFLGAIVIRMF
ncbi:MAG: hypothetical protein ABIG89_07385 [Candidatus Woesearchaeota archaeon]